METLLKKPEPLRDSMGRFDRHGKTLAKTAKKTGLINNPQLSKRGGARPGAGRPRGASGKATIQLREAVLSALDKLGGTIIWWRSGARTVRRLRRF
jgi:hypothetical protein